jgi:hypothetical protein
LGLAGRFVVRFAIRFMIRFAIRFMIRFAIRFVGRGFSRDIQGLPTRALAPEAPAILDGWSFKI